MLEDLATPHMLRAALDNLVPFDSGITVSAVDLLDRPFARRQPYADFYAGRRPGDGCRIAGTTPTSWPSWFQNGCNADISRYIQAVHDLVRKRQ